MEDANKSNLHYFESDTMKGLYLELEKWQTENQKRWLSTNIQVDGNKFCCIALTNPTEVMLVNRKGEYLSVDYCYTPDVLLAPVLNTSAEPQFSTQLHGIALHTNNHIAFVIDALSYPAQRPIPDWSATTMMALLLLPLYGGKNKKRNEDCYLRRLYPDNTT